MRTLASFTFDLAGPGFVVYSPFAMVDVATGSHFLRDHYTEPADVAAYVRAGSVAGCCTGSPGSYNVEIIDGALDHFMAALCPWWISLALEVRDHTVRIARNAAQRHRWPEHVSVEMVTQRRARKSRTRNALLVAEWPRMFGAHARSIRIRPSTERTS